jgi:hypothetical protein
VHHVAPVDAVALGDQRVLAGAVVDEQRVDVAAACQLERLAAADRDDADLDPSGGTEQRQEMREQARLLGRGGRAQRERALLCRRPAGHRSSAAAQPGSLPGS